MGNRLNLSANDNTRYKYHTDIIRLFGKDLKAHMTATYKIDEDWRIWFPKVYQNSDYINKLSEDGTSFEMNQLPESELTAQLIFPEDEPGNRLIFAHHKDPDTKEKYYKFIGVFTELKGNMKHASCKRIASSITLDGNGGFKVNYG